MRRWRFPVPLAGTRWPQWPFLPRGGGSQVLGAALSCSPAWQTRASILIAQKAVAGAQGTSEDQPGPGTEGLLPPTREAGARELPAPACQSCPHARRRPALPPLACLPEQLAGPGGGGGSGGLRGWRVAGGLGGLLTCTPRAPRLSSCLRAQAADSWAPFASAKPGGIWFRGDKATKPSAGCLAPRTEQPRRYRVIYGALLTRVSCQASGWGPAPPPVGQPTDRPDAG